MSLGGTDPVSRPMLRDQSHMVSCLRVAESSPEAWRLESDYTVTRILMNATMTVFSADAMWQCKT